ncbi:MAG: hypothetical protein ACREPW_05375 [Candidatus Binataceae bacterium]
MKYQGRKRRDGWMSIAIAGAAILAAVACGGCLYTVIPAMAGPSTTYQQPADSQPAEPANEQATQNKQQNGPQPQSQAGTP